MEQSRGVYAIPVGYVFRPEPLGFLVETKNPQDYVICEIYKKGSSRSSSSSSKRKLLVHDDEQVVMKKMRSTALSSTTTATSGDHNHEEVAMKKTQSSTCDSDDRELIDLIGNLKVEERKYDVVLCDSLAPVTDDSDQLVDLIGRQGVDDIVTCDSLAPVADSDQDRRGMITTKQCYPPPFDFPDEFWDLPAAGLPVHWEEWATSTCEHDDDFLGRLIVDDPTPWDGLGFIFSVLEEDSGSVDFDFIKGF